MHTDHETVSLPAARQLSKTSELYDELYLADGVARPAAAAVVSRLLALGPAELQVRQLHADVEILTQGITFTVYSDGRGFDRAWPFDVIPRVIDAAEWRAVEAGLAQRITAINRFVDDVYNEQRAIRDGVIPEGLLTGSSNFRPQCRGVRPPYGAWANIAGTDLVRHSDGRFYVLEDNLRVPSGASYVLENRAISKIVFADLFERQSILPVDGYTDELRRMLTSLSPSDNATTVVLTPGSFNSAYFEHAFLASAMGVELVEGRDLEVGRDGYVYMRTIEGRERVDVIYRRVDDLFLDPEVFRSDSTIGVPGLMRSWREGKVAIANCPGAGVADDKAVYAWVPDLIRYYLDEEPMIDNVPTWRCLDPDERDFVLDNLRELVVKPANESGGYGIVIGDRATDDELAAAKRAIESDPRNWVAQPIVSLSVVPTLCDGNIEPRHVDLRPFVLSSDSVYVTPGGLTRVARQRGSLIVNSSQGGGSKDTWIVDRSHPAPRRATIDLTAD